MEIILPKSNIMLSSAEEISQVCEPLREYGITAFSHTRVYNDNTFIDMADNVEMPDYFYYKSDIYKHYTPDVEPDQLKEDFFLCSTLEGNPAINVLKEDLNIDHIIVLTEFVEDHYEIWNFGTYRGNDKILNFYLNNLDLLKSFTSYFKDKGDSLIKKFEKDKITRIDFQPNVRQIYDKHVKKPNHFYANIKKFYLGEKYKATYLTSAEFKVLCWCVMGKTARESAIIMSVSRRTIERHLEQIKEKFKCSTKSSIVKLALESNLSWIIRIFLRDVELLNIL